MSGLKPAYLFSGNDHGRVGERRAGLRALAEGQGGAGGVEIIEGERSAPAIVAAALMAMTFSMGQRVVIVDGVERWKEPEVIEHLVPVLSAMPPETTVAFFARDEGRFKAPDALGKAVAEAGGDVREHAKMKARELPRWAVGEARRLGIGLDDEAAELLVSLVGERQQRILRELEKLTIEHGPGAQLGVTEVAGGTAATADLEVWSFIDAVIAGNARAATGSFLALRNQGTSLARLVPLMAKRTRELLAVSLRLEAGETAKEIKQTLKGSPWAADRRIAEARRADVGALRRATEALADLELATRGASELADDTVALRTIQALTA